MSVEILYEDNHLIAVYKPVGMLVQADDTGDKSLMDIVKTYLKETYDKPGNVFLGLLHRLDRPVSGIVLFAKTSKGASRLSEQFRTHRIKKIYTALLTARPKKEEATLIHYIKKDERTNTVSATAEQIPDSLRAELAYRIVGQRNNDIVVEVELKTGRPHQIRAQFAAIGCPLVGDIKYGAPKPLPDKSIALCATRLVFETATMKEQKIIQVQPPF